MRQPLVSILIVNWNGGEIFADCLRSLNKISYSNWELTTVDNASDDNSEKLPKKLITKAKRNILIKNKKNLGFAPANNIGVKEVKGKYVLLLNNDTKVEKDFLDKLINRIEQSEDIGIIQPKILIMDKPSHLDSVGSFLTRIGFLQHYGYLAKDSKEFSKEQYVFSAKGACMLIRKNIIDKVGLFDENYVSYLEETDFCWRVWLSGYKILYYPKAKILHKVGFTSKRIDQILVNYHSFKNRLATLYKNLDTINLLSIGFLHLLIIIFLMIYYFLRGRRRQAGMIWRSIFWNWKTRKKLTQQRKFVQKQIRVKSDREIFKYILKPFDFRGMFKHFVRSEKMLSGEHEV